MFFFFLSISLSYLTCRSPTGSSVPWFASFKVPKVDDLIPTHENGFGYFYRDDNTSLSEGPGDLDETEGGSNPIYESLRDMYERRDDPTLGYVLFSDQPPDGGRHAYGAFGRHAFGRHAYDAYGRHAYDAYGRHAIYSSTIGRRAFGRHAFRRRAHLKGVMIYDRDNAIYLVHSVPKFPPPPSNASSEYSFPSNGVNNSQSFLCMTIEHSELEKIAESCLLEFPFVYDSKEPDIVYLNYPNVHKLLQNQWNRKGVKYIADIKTKTKKFKLFGKSSKFGLDIYHDLIAPGLKADIYTSTWSKGFGKMDSDCSGSHSAFNVKSVNFGSVEWLRSEDHSKWAVAGSNVCIGGANRQKSQMSRGGDVFCIDFPSFAKEMMGTITEYEECHL